MQNVAELLPGKRRIYYKGSIKKKPYFEANFEIFFSSEEIYIIICFTLPYNSIIKSFLYQRIHISLFSNQATLNI